MNSRALYSSEPAKGWLPWGALAPFLGLNGLFVFLLVPFAAIGLLVLAWVRWVERRPLATIGLTRGLEGSNAGKLFLRGAGIGCLTILAVVLASWSRWTRPDPTT